MGITDLVILINNNNDTLDLYLIPGGTRSDGLLGGGNSYLIARWDNTLEYIPTDMELGDINGDGFSDIIFGFGNEHFENNDHDYNGSRLDTDGMVEIIHGSTLSSLLTDITWTSFLSPLDGRLANFGTEIAVIDMNNDGYDDIVVGAPYADKSDIQDLDDGAVYIIFGKAELKINSYNSDAESYESTDYGTSINYFSEFSGNEESEFGEAIAVGDFNGDGIGDYAVSMSEYGIPSGNGIVFIYLGDRFGPPQMKVVINGIKENAQLGDGQGSLHSLGDVNGDGYDDLGMKDAEGNFFIAWGQQSWTQDYDYNGDGEVDSTLLDLSDLNSLDGTYISGALVGSFFTFKGVGDVNNDGFDDFVINTPYETWTSNYSGLQTGQSFLVYGQSEWLGEFENADLQTVVINGDVLGLQVVGLGDFDNDGSDEFVLTSGYDYENQNIITWWGNDRPNESQPDPLLVLDNQTVLENSLGALIGNFTVSNLLPDETVDYTSIVLTGDHANLLTILSNGELRLTEETSLNFENLSDLSFSLNGYTSDGNQFFQDFSVKVVDVNEAPDFTLSKLWVNNNEIGAVLGAININDLELHDTYTYSIAGIDAEYFDLSSDGILKLKNSVTPNFEEKSDYSISITVSDASGLTVTKSITIGVNLPPTSIELSNLTIDESYYGIPVGELNIIDPNASDSISLTLSGPDESFFEITPDGVLKLKDNIYANYELKDSFALTVTAEDQGGLKVEKTFSIYVNNLDYATPYVSDLPSLYTLSQPDDYYVKAMLFGITLDPDDDPSTPLTVTYSVINPNSVFAPGYRGEYFDNPHLNIQTPTEGFKSAIDKAFQLWGQVTGINFVKITETDEKVGDIRVGLTEVGEWAGISLVDIYGLNSSFQDSGDSDIWIENGGGNLAGNWQDGTFGFQTLLHEIGHSLGFKHPHSAFNNPSGWYSPPMVSEYDAQYWSVMAYRDYVGDELKPSLDGFDHQHEYLGCGICGSLNHSVLDSSSQMETKNGDAIYPYTPMFFDIYASLYLYAYNKDTGVYEIPENNPGDDTYTISGPVNFTIYDTDGTDTLDFTILDLNSEINLDAPLSFIGTDEINYDDGEFYTGYIVSIFFYNDMENVNAGGGRDTITCNIAVNTINCGPGPDTVNAISSGDIIYGEVGNDTFVISDFSFNLIDGGAGIDRLDLTNQAADGSDIDLAVFDDSQIRDVEEISLLNDNISTLIKLTKDSILNFNSSRASDQDGDGDVDNLFYVLGDSKQDFVSLLSAEGWTYFKTENSYDWYQSSDGDVYFATTEGMGTYEISTDSNIAISSSDLVENVVNAVIGSFSITNFNELSPTDTIIYSISGADADKFSFNDAGECADTPIPQLKGLVIIKMLQTTKPNQPTA